MTIKEMYIGVQQGLRSIPVFANATLEFEEVDVLMNHITPLHIQDLYRIRRTDETVLEQLRVLEKVTDLVPVKGEDFWYADLPSDYLYFSKGWSVVDGEYDGKLTSSLEPGKKYITECQVKINGVWRQKGFIFTAKEDSTIYGGQVRQIPTKRVPNRLNEDNLLAHAGNSFYRRSRASSPIGEVGASTYRVYGDFNVYHLILRYYKQPPLFKYGTDGSRQSIFTQETNEALIQLAIEYYRDNKRKS